MIEWLTLAPPLALAVAGACAVLGRPADGRVRGAAIVVLVGTAVVTAAAMTWLLFMTDRSVLHLPLSPWSNAVFTGDPALDVERVGAACMAAVGGLALAVVLRAPRADAHLGIALLVAAASALFIAAARTPLGLVSAWLMLDAALFFGPRIGRRGLLASQVGLLWVLAALMDVPIDAATLDATPLSAWTRAWLAGAAMARMGLYPLWWTVPRAAAATAREMPATRLAPMLAGAYLLLAATPGVVGGPSSDLVTVLGLVAAWAGAVVAWSTPRGAATVDWMLVHLGGMTMVAAALPGPIGKAAATLVLAEAMVFGVAAYAGSDLPSPAARWAGRLAAASAAGALPGAGLIGRWLILQTALSAGMPAVAALVALSTVPVVARWARDARAPLPAGAPSAAATAVVGGAVTLNLLWGLTGVLALVVRGRVDVPWPPVLALQPSVAVLAGIGLPLVFGVLLRGIGVGRLAGSVAPGDLARAVRLTTAFDAMRSASIRAGRFIHDRLGLVDSQRAMGWTLLAGLATGLAFLVPPASTAMPEGNGGWIGVAAAAGIAAAMLLVAAPAVCLAALAAGYALAGGALLTPGAGLDGPQVVLGAIKLVTGAVVVAILALSWTQARGVQTRGSRPAAAARRALAALRGDTEPDEDRGLAAICLAIALLAALGVPSATMPETLPLSALRVALGLTAGGVLTAVFARTALRVACGILLALCGFDLIYAHIEPGLLITGGLAVFHIAYTMVATAFLGDDSVRSELA